ncbi:PAS domain-containing protein [Flavobacterium sp.]|uniref:PAS domain-containing protein n=1 Tax=Flavobacterium sp. TaxID=239 RepID=UPI00286D99B5|nr:PAS domain-containing protein [Flavobacterium sp.]
MQNQQDNYNITPMDNEQKLFGLSYRPTPSDRELEWDRSKVLLSKTDSKGNILYANEAFIDVCGYDDFELMDKSHNIVRHPDMPKVVFKLLWESLNKGNGFHSILKNMSKTGRYYWVFNDLKVIIDDKGDTFYTGTQKSIGSEIISNSIEPLYKKLLQIEKASGVQSSENYLLGFLEERNTNYVGYIDNLHKVGYDNMVTYNASTPESTSEGKEVNIPKKKGFFSGFFADNGKSTPKKK